MPMFYTANLVGSEIMVMKYDMFAKCSFICEVICPYRRSCDPQTSRRT